MALSSHIAAHVRMHVAGILATTAFCVSPVTHAQDPSPTPVEVQLDKSASKDLYVTRRPTTPERPTLPKVLADRLHVVENHVHEKRDEAITLLQEFLDGGATGDGRAEGLFKLAELRWEDATRVYLLDIDEYERNVEACRTNKTNCLKAKKEPRISFAQSEALYREILENHNTFRRTDLALYLVGFAAQEDQRFAEALDFFAQVVKRFPNSPLYADAWLMIGEHFFAGQKWENAREAYLAVLDKPDADGYDLALFKMAWCDWKLGDADQAAKRFKLVLDLAAEAERSGTDRERKRRSQLRDEALDYLVLVFTEDPNIKAADVFQFLASIGGERYSKSVIVKLASVYYDQGDYERSVEAYRFLIKEEPTSIKSAEYQRKVVDAYLDNLQRKEAMAELKILIEDYGQGSAWAKANAQNSGVVTAAYTSTEVLVRNMAKTFHAEAQSLEKSQGQADKAVYLQAANTYGFYLESFADDSNAAEVRFLHAEILFFKLEKFEAAGDEYLAVGQTSPVGTWHKDALLRAMSAFRTARPKHVDTSKRRELLPVDRKFAIATDLYATLFPADPKLVGVIYENGQLFYDYGDYDEAIKRFGLIVTKYPDDPNAGAAGDRILDALNKGQDYENIEDWARKLRGAKAFESPEQLARLDRLIVESIGKSGEKYAESGNYTRAAGFYMRIPKEFPQHPLAAQSMFNAAVLLEKAKKPEQAADTYQDVAKRFPDSDLAAQSAFTAGSVYESMAYYERAAEAYEKTFGSFPKGDRGANALFNAGLLRQALGQSQRAIGHFEAYAKRFRKTKKDAEEVAFRIGVVYDASGNYGPAEKAYRNYLSAHRSGKHAIEAMVNSSRAAYKLGQYGRAKTGLRAALQSYKKMRGDSARKNRAYAAEARYYQGELLYRDYAKVSLNVKPRKLDTALQRKMKLLEQASGIYLDVVEYKDASWSTAALYRIGSVMEEFAISLRDAPTPAGFSDAEAEQYRTALDEEVVTIEERAIELYTTGYRKAIELRVYNEYTKKLRSALGRMSASRFPPTKEARQTMRLGDRTPASKIRREVIRDE